MDWNIALTVGVIMAIGFAAGFVHSAIGFGFGIVVVTLLPWVVDARQSQILVSLASVPVMVGATWTYRKGGERRAMFRAVAGALVGLPLGIWVFDSLNMDWLVRGTGVAILAMVAMSFRNRRLAQATSDQGGAGEGYPSIAGAVAGFLAGAVSIAGPPIVAFALQRNWQQLKFKAFVNQFLCLVSIFKVVGLGFTGDVTTSACLQTVWLILPALLGIGVGAACSRHLSSSRFHTAVAVALVTVSIVMVVRGAKEREEKIDVSRDSVALSGQRLPRREGVVR